MKLWKWQMIELVLLLLLLLSCESKPTEEQLVRECQNRNGVPNTAEGRVQMGDCLNTKSNWGRNPGRQ